MKRRESLPSQRLRVLLAKFGYRFEETTTGTCYIIQKAIRGWTSESRERCRDIYDGCERLIPIIHNDKFSDEYRLITGN